MKTLIHFFFFYCTAGFLLYCTPSQSVEDRQFKSPRTVSDNYKPRIFTDDQRADKIRSLAPEIHRLVEEHAKEIHIPGVAYGIVVDDELVVASSIGFADPVEKTPVTTRSCFRIASMTKSFTAMAIMKLRDEGKLLLSDPAAEYIPEMAGLEYLTSDSPVIDIENLLTMTAGFPEDNPWGDRQLDEPVRMLTSLIEEGISFSNVPSFEFEYSNTAYALLGLIITRVSGMPYQEYIRNSILHPLGMDNTYWEYDSVPDGLLVPGYRWEDDKWKPEPMLHHGSYGAMGGLITTIEDFGKYVSFQLSAWPPRSGKEDGPVKRSTLREMQTPHFPRLFADAKDFNGDPCAVISGYGFGLGVSQDCNGIKRVSHGGALPGFGSNYSFFPEYGLGIMAFCNLTYTSPWPAGKIVGLLFDSIALQPRELPVSDILKIRKEQVLDLIRNWDQELESEILAENFYLDKSRDHRMTEIRERLDKAGAIQRIGDMEPLNQLRGSFNLEAENGTLRVFFTLTPERDPKVQYLNVIFRKPGSGGSN